MLYADMLGLQEAMGQMRQFASNAHADPVFWQPAPLLAKLASEGRSLTA